MSFIGVPQLRWTVIAVAAGAMVALTPATTANGAVESITSAGTGSITGASGLTAQQGGPCERKARPACNRQGRRSTHK